MSYMNREQSIKKQENIKKVIEYFDNHGGTIDEIASNLNMSTSSVQRYLNDELVSNLTSKEDALRIKEYLKSMKKAGNKLGGINYSINNEAIKDELGHFKGSKRCN